MTRNAPLRGVRIAVTRPVGASDDLAAALSGLGAIPVVLPLTRIEPPLDPAPLERALAHTGWDWVVFTSANAVAAVAHRLRGRKGRIAAVGPATAAAVEARLGRRPDAVPEEYTGAALVPAMLERGALAGARVLWPRAEHARDTVRTRLKAAGALLTDPIAYRTVPDPAGAQDLARLAAGGSIDAIVFAAPSAVMAFMDAGGAPYGTAVAAIGATTAEAARERGLPVHIEPKSPTIPALVEALAVWFGGGAAR